MAMKNKKFLPTFILISVLVISIIANIFIGAENISIKDLFIEPNSFSYKVIMYLRLPRIIACIFVGAGLSVAGLLLQTMLNNSLASPGIIGINSGAGLAIVLGALLIPFHNSFLNTFITFLGAFLTALLIYLIAKTNGSSKSKLILAGIAISRLFSSLIDTICYIDPTILTNKTQFVLGSFSKLVGFESILFPCLIIIIGLVGALLLSRYLGVLTLGDDVAQSLGLNVKMTRFLILLDVALLSAGAVSCVGLLTFLGLIVPHISRKIFGVEDQKKLTFYTILIGAILTLICDLLARTILGGFEFPVGIIMSILGIPFFIILIFNKGGHSRRVNHK